MHLIPLAPLLAAVAAADLQEARTETYSIQSLLIGQDQGLQLSALPRYTFDRGADLEVTDRDGLGRVVAGDVQDVFFRLLDLFPEQTSGETYMTLRGNDQLVVKGSQTWHRHVQTLLAQLERIVGHHTSVRVAIIPGELGAFDGVAAGSTVSIDALDGLLGANGMAGVEQFVLDLRVGATGFFDQSRLHPLVRDYDVEIATGSGVLDPDVVGARTGTRVAARYVPHGSGGRLSLLLDRSELIGGPKQKELALNLFVASGTGDRAGGQRIAVVGQLDHQELLTRGLALDHGIQVGEVLLARLGWSLGDASGEELIGVTVEHEPLGAIEVVPVGGRALVFVDREAIEGSFAFAQRPDAALLCSHGSGRITKPLALTIARAQPNLEFALLPRASTSWGTLGNWLVAGVDSVDQARRIEAEIQPLLRKSERGARLRATTTADGQLAGLVEVPAPIDGQGFGFVARSTPRLYDMDVEVATNSLLGDPSVADLETGIAIGLVPRGAGDTRSVEVRTDALRQIGEARTTQLPVVPGGFTEHLDFTSLRLDQRVPLGIPIGARELQLTVEWL